MENRSSSIAEIAEQQGDGTLSAADAHALLEIAAKHRIAASVALDPIIMVDHEGKISLWNEAAENVFGYTASEALGQDPHALIVPARYWEASARAFRQFQATGEGAAIGRTRELVGMRKGGEEFPLELSLSALRYRGQWVAVGSVRDITERKRADLALQQSEAKLRAILDASPAAHALSDEHGNIVLLNKAFVRLFGYTREDIPDLRSWWSLAYPDPQYRDDVRAAWRDHLDRTKHDGIQFEPLDLDICCKDGRVRSALVTSVSFSDPSGKTFLAIFHDITERKLAERQLQSQFEDIARVNAQLLATNRKLSQAQNQLLQSEKMASIGLLAAGVAHEINNPVGYVFSNLGTLEKYLADIFAVVAKYEDAEGSIDSPTPEIEAVRQFEAQIDLDYLREDIRSLLVESREGLMRVRKIVLDLKDFSHTGSEEEWKQANLQEGLESTLSVVWNELKYKCEVVKEYAELPLVQCLPSQLNQVFMNLLVNAAQAIETHGVVTIRSGREAGQVWVEVADTGKGISPEHLPHLFDPFFTTKPVGQGTGLGLAVSFSIVEKHHGRLEVHSEVGKGAAFRLWLPVQQPDAVVTA